MCVPELHTHRVRDPPSYEDRPLTSRSRTDPEKEELIELRNEVVRLNLLVQVLMDSQPAQSPPTPSASSSYGSSPDDQRQQAFIWDSQASSPTPQYNHELLRFFDTPTTMPTTTFPSFHQLPPAVIPVSPSDQPLGHLDGSSDEPIYVVYGQDDLVVE